MKIKIIICAVLLAGLQSCQNGPKSTEQVVTTNSIAAIDFKLKAILPHDSTLFTEGLLVYNGELIESTGSPDDMQKARSLIGKMDLKTGKLDIKVELDRSKYFGEGIAILNNKLYQLTYKNREGFIYDATTFKKLGGFKYNNLEGWGMTTDGKQLIMSDGTSVITFLDPQSLLPVKTINVTKYGQSENMINELEYINGFIYANIWLSNFIVKIDPSNGKIVGRIDLGSIFTMERSKNILGAEMNGIAFDAKADKVYITGKLWKHIYEIEFAK
ncbi:glutaminyl-peptide cyclotransferase [Pedobacter psychroterrae]|uniref:Glutaminyl-peptide cyclotransferase n=1 Tax=Pedobacter psychroterrae TaxID=2530453 RepID=A0A4R0NLP0_9SPHI|nr:glutaminyl-peptide cyclotransferase [Pedobacter psychroterrae]TCD00214.1 glutaminyl-peptide cyclotransferase [Pedobacter psychroterrae]